MTFQNLWPLAFLILIPVIVFFYILKQKARDEEFSSTMLWDEAYRNIEAKKPFEKFKHNILMYLQILILVLLIAALMAPIIRNAAGEAQNVVLIIDSSASMDYAYEDGSRLDEAKRRAVSKVDSLNDADVVTLIECGPEAEIVYQGKNKATVSARIGEIVQTDAEGSAALSESIVNSLISDMENVEIVCYTDTELDPAMLIQSNENACCTVSSVYSGGENCAVDYVNYTIVAGAADSGDETSAGDETSSKDGSNPTGDDASEESASAGGEIDSEDGANSGDKAASSDSALAADVLCSVTNYGSDEATFDVYLYADSTPVDIQSVTLAGGGQETVFFDTVTLAKDVQTTLRAVIDVDDALSGDNCQSVSVTESSEKRILIISDGNVFLEKAFSLGDSYDVYKADDVSVLSADDVYDLYVFDGVSGLSDMSLEESGIGEGSAMLFINMSEAFSDTPDFIQSSKELENVYLTFDGSSVTDYIEGSTFGISEGLCYTLPEGAEAFLADSDGNVCGYMGQCAGRNSAVIGFDLHSTDLALRTEYPIFMTQLAGSLMGSAGYSEETENFPTASESSVAAAADETTGEGKTGAGTSDRSLRNILLAAAAFLLVIEWLVYIRQINSRRKYQYLVIRCAVLICIVLAFAGLTVTRTGRNVQTIFLVDMSDSMSGSTKEISEYLKSCIGEKEDGDSYAVIAFGGDTSTIQFMTDEASGVSLDTDVEKTATNIENALITARSMYDDDAAKRLVLITDGQENEGSMNKAAATFAHADVELLAISMRDVEESSEVYIESMEVPSVVHEGDVYNITVTVMSNVETDCALTLYSGRTVKAIQNIHVTSGENQFVFSDTGTVGTIAGYKAVIEPDEDTEYVNNTYVTYAEIDARPKVLIVTGGDESSGEFEKVLAAANIEYESVTARTAPKSVNLLTQYKAVITMNCHYDDLPAGFVTSLETYVKDYAGGYICIGGDDSYALGGYRDTELEDILPVDMDLQGEKEIPEMAMVMVIDHSGSMSETAADGSGLTSLTLAKQAAVAAVGELRSTDEVGVLEFDDTYAWVYELSDVGDAQAAESAIEGITIQGGTSIYPAVKAAYDAVKNSDAAIKHIVLLTDGQDEFSDYGDLTEKLTASGVTLSTVAVGEGADTATLSTLAEDCGGRYYYTDINNSIPRIFAQEVYLSTEEYLKNGEFYPTITSTNEIVGGVFDDGMPALYGYIATSAKQTADVVLASDEGDPILAVWQCGLGRTAAWCSDGTFDWTAGCAEWDGYPQLWSNIINYVITSTDMGDDSVEVTRTESGNRITYKTDDYDTGTQVSAVITDEDGNQTEVTFTAVSPGTYQTDVDSDEVGVYSASIRKESGGEVVKSYNTAFANQYSKEYTFADASGVLESFVSAAGGQFVTTDDDVWSMDADKVRVQMSLTIPLLILAVLLLIWDIAARRLALAPFDRMISVLRVAQGKAAVFAARRRTGQETAPPQKNNKNFFKTKIRKNEESVESARRMRKAASKPDNKANTEGSDTLDVNTLLRKKHDRE